MRKLLYILLLTTQLIWSQSDFEKGNDFYRKEQYEKAAQAYENVLKSKKHSAELYFNLANAYYKLNKVGPAVYNYEKALLLNPEDADIKNNLVFAHKMMIDEVVEMPKVGFDKLITDFTSIFSYDAWARIAVALAFVFLVFFCGYYFSAFAFYKRIFFIAMLIGAILIVIAIFAAIFEKDRYLSERPAIVFSGIASVKSEPKTASADALTLHEGTKVYVLEELDSWKKIQLPDGNDGWIETSAIRELKSF
jgi:tetratricopeptide (TPR) repeat protein